MPHKDLEIRKRYALEKRKRDIENKKYQCGRCERVFRDTIYLRNHVKMCTSGDVAKAIIPGDDASAKGTVGDVHIDEAPVTMSIPSEEEEMEELKRIAMKYGWL
jgi:hypothetical protein